MQIVSQGDNLHEMSKPTSGKIIITTIIITYFKMSSAEFLPGHTCESAKESSCVFLNNLEFVGFLLKYYRMFVTRVKTTQENSSRYPTAGLDYANYSARLIG